MANSDISGTGEDLGNARSGPGSHEEFLELAAVSTAGDLTPEEQKRLREHLAACPGCGQALKEFEAVVDVGVPSLASEFDQAAAKQTITVPAESSQARVSGDRDPRSASALRNGHRRTEVNWNLVCLPFAAAILLTMTLAIYTYRAGEGRGAAIVQANVPKSDLEARSKLEALEQQLSDAGHERGVLKAELAERDGVISDLRRRMQTQASALNEMQTAQANLENSVRADEASKQRTIAQERDTLKQDLDAAEVSLRAMRTQLDSVRQKQSEDQLRETSLEGQIKDLFAELRDREQTISKDEELLSRDRDIRDLMGSRDLYIAEVYDVGRDGATQKPYGRVFHTRGKSLIFYAYDLDQQPGAKGATFQAWGRRGPDTRQALNLGVFYKDDIGKKRWVLKFEDPKMLDQIDAVFVTLQPNGAARQPNGKSLLFAYLKVDPNHP